MSYGQLSSLGNKDNIMYVYVCEWGVWKYKQSIMRVG